MQVLRLRSESVAVFDRVEGAFLHHGFGFMAHDGRMEIPLENDL